MSLCVRRVEVGACGGDVFVPNLRTNCHLDGSRFRQRRLKKTLDRHKETEGAMFCACHADEEPRSRVCNSNANISEYFSTLSHTRPVLLHRFPARHSDQSHSTSVWLRLFAMHRCVCDDRVREEKSMQHPVTQPPKFQPLFSKQTKLTKAQGNRENGLNTQLDRLCRGQMSRRSQEHV